MEQFTLIKTKAQAFFNKMPIEQLDLTKREDSAADGTQM